MTLCEARAETLQRLLDGRCVSHAFSAMFPQITEEDFDKLVDDIKKNGLLQPIVVYQDKILDGNNRYRACLQAKVEPRCTELVEASDAQAQAFVISANIHRRHLSREQRAAIIAMLLKADPSKSNRQIAETTKTSHHTVEAVRTELEATGQIAQLNKTTGADGKTRKTKGGKTKGGKDKKQTDAQAATKAYHALQEKLIDALDDLKQVSSFAHAEEYAEKTKERIDETIKAMREEKKAA